MFKFKRKKKAYKLAKAEQKEIIKNSTEETLILLVIFSILTMFFSKEMATFFNGITKLTNLQRLEVIILFIPIFLILGIIYTVAKVIIKRYK